MVSIVAPHFQADRDFRYKKIPAVAVLSREWAGSRLKPLLQRVVEAVPRAGFSRWSVLGEDFVEVRGVDHAVGPGFQLLGLGAGEAVEHVVRKRAEAAGELAAQDGAFAFDTAFLHTYRTFRSPSMWK